MGYYAVRFFRTADDELYEQVRLTLDAAWGHPTPDGLTVTCFDPAAVAPRDTDGRLLLAVQDEFCEYTVAVDLLPQLLAAGLVDEIDEQTYRESQPQRQEP